MLSDLITRARKKLHFCVATDLFSDVLELTVIVTSSLTQTMAEVSAKYLSFIHVISAKTHDLFGYFRSYFTVYVKLGRIRLIT